jgi:pimeloyl-ACP methyl ester carboxylesterase
MSGRSGPPGTSERVAGARGVLIAEGAGHWPHREAPVFHERLIAWLGAPP